MDNWIRLLTAVAPVLVAVVTIIPTIISNRKKTQDSLQAMRDEIAADISATKREVTEVRDTLSQHILDDEETNAKLARYRILRFYDEVCEGRLHSESHFEDILDDIDKYEQYCDTHRDFKNNRGHVAMKYIRDTYGKIKAKGVFLTHD
jgi:hypothetical protein